MNIKLHFGEELWVNTFQEPDSIIGTVFLPVLLNWPKPITVVLTGLQVLDLLLLVKSRTNERRRFSIWECL